MINYLKGALRRVDAEESRVVVEVCGVGYEVLLPFFVMRSLQEEQKQEGEELELEVYYHASERQPKPVLVGFKKGFERSFFEKLKRGVIFLNTSRAGIVDEDALRWALDERDLRDWVEPVPSVYDCSRFISHRRPDPFWPGGRRLSGAGGTFYYFGIASDWDGPDRGRGGRTGSPRFIELRDSLFGRDPVRTGDRGYSPDRPGNLGPVF